MATNLQAPKGVAEYVPPNSAALLKIRDALLEASQLAGYQYVELPVFEDTQLYVRGVGEATDVVSKEMYTFEDRGGRSLTLRPEGTAGLVRSVIEHRLDRGALPVKLSYTGPFFRAERPQKGRYRQFYQFGVEAIGSQDPMLDAEVISVALAGIEAIGLKNCRLLVNTLGDAESREVYREKLVEYLADFDLDEATQERIKLNPLRVLDDKRPEMQEILKEAPKLSESLTPSAKERFDQVLASLDALSIAYEVDDRLVRGLDYYVHTTFEFVHDGLGAQAAVGGGGRYDGLLATLGGQDLGGIGFGMGIDRLILATEAENLGLADESPVDVFVLPLGEEAVIPGMKLAQDLRSHEVATGFAFDQRSVKSAMKSADRSGARFAVIIGEQELANSEVTVKDLRDGTQQNHSLDTLATWLKGEIQ
ncbi:MAG: histidine--tRNA ligase [Candidatus Nanopelagicales bacterium]